MSCDLCKGSGNRPDAPWLLCPAPKCEAANWIRRRSGEPAVEEWDPAWGGVPRAWYTRAVRSGDPGGYEMVKREYLDMLTRTERLTRRVRDLASRCPIPT